jgi:hypothetical protein
MCGENPKLSAEYFCQHCAEHYLIPHMLSQYPDRHQVLGVLDFETAAARVAEIRSQFSSTRS